MQQPYICFFDIDNTLWDFHMNIPESTKEAIRCLHENGHYVFLNSGRARAMIRDPRLFADAVRFERIGYDAMMGLIENGAQVLHDRSVEFAREYKIPVEVLSAFTGNSGTVVGDLE